MRYASLSLLVAAMSLVACAGSKTSDTASTGSASTAAATGPAAGGKLYVLTPAPYDKNSGADPKVKEECALGIKVSQKVQESAQGKFDVVPSKTLADAGKNKALSLTIVGVQGVAGGAWSGAKTVRIQGSLKQGGKVIGTFTGQRSSTGGMWGGYKSTCGIFERDTEALGKDVAEWLVAPSMNAKLGELK